MHPTNPTTRLQAALNETDDPWDILARVVLFLFERHTARGVPECCAHTFASQSIARFLNRIGAPSPLHECTWTNFTTKSNERRLDKEIEAIYYGVAARRGL